MNPSIENMLSSNGIFRSRFSNGLDCRICQTSADFFDWKKHTRDPRHLAIFRSFQMIFRSLGDRIECKLCKNENLDWKFLRVHARSHDLIPWYEPPDRYKIFFNNHILEWETQFYCYPCDKFFPEWSSALYHTNDDKHKNLVKMEVPVNDLSSWNVVDIPYELLVNEGLVIWAARSFKCTICNRLRIDLEQVTQHCEDTSHAKLKIGFVREMKEWKRNKMISAKYDRATDKDLCEAQNNSHAENIPDLSSIPNLPTRFYIVKREGSNFCRICNVKLLDDLSTIDNHMGGIPHLTNVKRYALERIVFRENEREYYCECCNCRILGIDNVFLHAMGFKHTTRLSVLGISMEQPEIAAAMEISSEKDICEELRFEPASLPPDHIVEVDGDFICQICNWKIIRDATDDHVTGIRHEKSVKQYHENITICKDKYRCKCCDCIIFGVENLYLHLMGNRHGSALKKSEMLEDESRDNEIKADDPTILIKPKDIAEETLCYDHIVKIDDDKFSCKICDCQVCQTDIDAHVKDNNHGVAIEKFQNSIILIKSDKYHCKNCDCFIRGIDNVYLHVHGIRHSPDAAEKKNRLEIEKSKKMTEKATELVNPTMDKPEVDENKNIENPVKKARENENSKMLDENTKGTRNDCEEIEKDLMNHEFSADSKNHADSNLNSKFSNSASRVMIETNSPSDDEADEKICSMRNEASPERALRLSNLDKHDIYDMKEKLREIELGMKYSFVNDSKIIYCLICRKDIGKNWQTYFRHLWTLEHCDYLDGMEKDHDLFELLPGRLSELDLALQSMEEICEESVFCHVCSVEMKNDDYSIRNHVDGEIHEKMCSDMRSRSKKHFEAMKMKIHCDWYKIYKFSCVPCSLDFTTEASFSHHFKTTGHSNILKKMENPEKQLIHDFCEKCCLLWYGFRSTYAIHCEDEKHKETAMSNGNFETDEIEKFSKNSPVQFIHRRVKNFDGESVEEREKKIEHLFENIANGLSIENANLIKFFVDIFPSCKKLLLLLEEWLMMCNLLGNERITIYALYWYVVFFLQRESLLPNVASVIATNEDSFTKSVWKYGVSRHAKDNTSFENLLKRFFTFYANFDYRHDVACPLIGDVVKKRAFDDPKCLPKEMGRCIDFTKNSKVRKSFQIDSVMCIQDPLDPRENLTKCVTKEDMSFFRTCCRRSSNALVVDQ